MCVSGHESLRVVLKGQEHLLVSESPKYCLYSEYVFQEPGAWIIHSYPAVISLCEYQYANISSIGIQNTLHAHKETQGVHGSRLSKSIKMGNKHLNEIQLLIQPAVNMIKLTIDPQTLLVGTAGSSHFSSVSVAYCAMNHAFFPSVFELFMNFNMSYL